MGRKPRFNLDAAEGRGVSSGSVYSTILLNHAIQSCAGGAADATGANAILDVGCGESPYRNLLAPTTYVGVDRRPRVRPADLAVVADVMAIPTRGRFFDGVVCTEVIEHVNDERELMKELARVARPGAKLVLSSPFVHGLHEMPYDFRRLTSIGLASVLEEAGWKVDAMSSVGGPLVVAVDSFVRWANQWNRAIANKLLKKGSPAHRLTVAPTVKGQKVLAGIALRSRWTRLGAIDPYAGKPRLTLGYVVVATRKDV
ncbi:MAG: class I SAM-dependent methyltransferase [Microthrixaceae bacterium]